MRSPRPLIAPFGLCLILGACESIDLEGGWSGTWHTADNAESGAATMGLIQDGETITGTFNLDTSCVETGSVSGGLDDRVFTATLTGSNGAAIQFEADVAENAYHMDGTFNVTTGACQGVSGSIGLNRE